MKNKGIMVGSLVVGLLMLAAPRAAAAEDAAALYKAKCAACHGADGVATAVGKKMNARDFSTPEVMKMSEAQMIETTTKGKEKMPAYEKKLNADQIKALVEYVRSMSKAKK